MTSSASSVHPAPADLALALAPIATLLTKYRVWARTCYTIRDKDGRHRPLLLNGVQRAIGRTEAAELARKGEARIFVLKARQGGVSTDQQARALWQIWREPGFDALTLAYTKEDTEKLFNITTRAVEHFPPALLPRLGERVTSQVGFPELDTILYTGTAGSKRTGRGLTIKRLHGSEFAFWGDPEGTLATVGPGLVPQGSTIVLETTASGYDSAPHLFWRDAEAKGYVRLFFGWWLCDPEKYRTPLVEPDELGILSDEEAALVAGHGLDLEQVKWRRLKMAEYGRVRFLTEYAEDEESCWAAVGGMFFNADELKALLLDPPTPKRTERHDDGDFDVYLDPADLAPHERVIVGADTAEGSNPSDGDRSAAIGRTFPTNRRVFSYASRGVTPKQFAGHLARWGRAYRGAFLVVEKNMHGITVLRELRDELGYPAGSIYHRPPLDQAHNAENERIGWATTAESQPIMLDAARELFAAAARGDAERPIASVVRDAFGVRRDEKGKYSLNGKDMLVAEALAWIGRTAPSSTGLITFYAQQLEAKRQADLDAAARTPSPD